MDTPRRQTSLDKNEEVYCLEAVLADEAVLTDLARTIPHAHIVPIGQHVSLLPITGAVVNALNDGTETCLEGFALAPATLGPMLAGSSKAAPLAYVEAEYFGGAGTQSAQIWHEGEIILGPIHLREGERPPPEGTPISQALRQLGVEKGNHFDEFDAVELGRHRRTEDWLTT
ncbi:hypothetical protein LWC34_23950 [Kibdelosporangium philippinense]|uniref:Uncharacterized protein n=1 Tax=Kibdelosporangium philippinense TaxID=211113 RepID=A0ABS8ZDD4_9PSEU|nr:hypothetical protein [Kibdelosporangium philippinense]MCE7005858.1 hypothetical protein [Kibdelosporangium philippinense]